ncbi:MAG: hypothetical protein RIS88_2779 [Pseudomonadota bacterium]|jgi:hypothetical protein
MSDADQHALTASEAAALVIYDQATGKFYLRSDGREVGFVVAAKGYVCLKLAGKKYNAHRVAWLLATGHWPVGEIDHINQVKTDNRLMNLRDVPRVVNAQNQTRAHKRNGTGLLGVHYDKDRDLFIAAIFSGGRKRFLGRHKTAEAAHAAYVSAKRRIHEGCTI